MTRWAWAAVRLMITTYLAFNCVYGVTWFFCGWHNELNWFGMAFFMATEVVMFYVVFGLCLLFEGPPTTMVTSYKYGRDGQYAGYVNTYVPTPPSPSTLPNAVYCDDLGFSKLLGAYWVYFLITRLIWGHAPMVLLQMSFWGWLVRLCV